MDVRLPAVALAAVFAVASAAKLRDRDGTVETFDALGLRRPERLAVAVPAVEVLAAVELIVMPLVGAVLSLVLLAAFTVVLVGAIHRGVPLNCACFGAVATHDAPVGWGSVARNAVLAAVALVVLFGAPGLSEWMW